MEQLPVELLYRIFDNLDAETLLISVRSVCHRFRSITQTYNRFILDYRSISKRNFYLLSHRIDRNHVRSLILSNDKTTSNQIDLFISFDYFNQLTCLRSLKLFHIDELQLNILLQQINPHLLTTFALSIRDYDETYLDHTPRRLTNFLQRSNLQTIEIHLENDRFSKISWSNNLSLRHLIIHGQITLLNFLSIFQSSPHLNQLVLSEFPHDLFIQTSSITFPQLCSLTIHDVRTTIDQLETFLLLTPSLISLKLIGGKMMLNGKRWEDFITKNLLDLNKFQFYFTQWELIQQTERDLQLIINSFQTPFWIEKKKWFVTCKYDLTLTGTIHLYSIPMCRSYFIYEKGLKVISLSTYSNKFFNTENINSLDLILNKSLANEIEEQTNTNDPLFPEVKQINLEFYEQWPLFTLEKLSILIDFARLVRLTIHSNYFNDYNETIWIDISNFLQQSMNLSNLVIQTSFDTYHSDKTIEHFSSILPDHIKHFEISIQNLKQIQILLHSCRQLSTITLNNYETKLYDQMIQWFEENTIHSTCRISHGMISVWLGKTIIQMG